jgi:CBS domain-containing protein
LKVEVIQMLKVRDVMSRSVISVHRGTPLKDVAGLLIDHRVSGVPVVDPDGAVLGVVSEADLLIKEQGAEAIRHRRLARFVGESRESRVQLAKLAALTAGEAMTSPAVTIGSGSRISEAAALMTARKVNRLPVVDDGRLVGIVTRADLVRAYVRSDDELSGTIREEVLLHILWLDPAEFSVVVSDGVASISGHVQRRSTAEMIGSTVSMVPGIIDVNTDVSWAVDDSRVEPVSIDPFVPFGPH